MRAVVYHDYGGPDVLSVCDLDRPEPAANEVLIRVVAAGVNPIDARLRSGEARFILPGGFPRVPGYDVAGIVEACGRDTPFATGDTVLAFLDHVYGGGYAEYAVCSASCVAPLPAEMTFQQAAALPLAGSTALQSLRDHGHLRAGQRVLITGASGGVGAFAVPIAKWTGATVTAVASGSNEAFVRSLGADEFVDYHTTDFAAIGQTWDLIFDAAGKSRFADVKSVLTDQGRFVSTEIDVRGLLETAVTAPFRQRSRVMLAQANADDLDVLTRLWTEGRLPITVAETFPLADARQAHARIEAGGFRGKLVLEVSPP